MKEFFFKNYDNKEGKVYFNLHFLFSFYFGLIYTETLLRFYDITIMIKKHYSNSFPFPKL